MAELSEGAERYEDAADAMYNVAKVSLLPIIKHVLTLVF